ncbi:MAG: hypothetical protein E6772_12240 [Dysgonomonas sp.]|nr:hypothetical protein [Dysgonomonas sp.]
MKKFLLCLLIAITAISSNAQKNVNVDNYRFAYAYRALPKKPLNPMFFYYGIQINIPSTMSQIVDTEMLSGQVVIEGQRYTEELKADDILVDLSMQPVNILSTDIKERVEEVKDKEGKVTSRKYFYCVVVSYNFDAKAIVTQGEKKVGNYILKSRTQTLTYQSSEYSTSRAASEYWKNNRENMRENFTTEQSNAAVKSLSQLLTSDFGFATIKTTDIIKTINEKKHPENEPLRAMSDKLKANLETMDANTPLAEENITDVIEYFKNIPVRYTDPKLKADVRLRYVAYYNLCKIYLHLDQPEKVKEYADLIFENGHDKGDAKKMNNEAEKLMERFNSSDIKTRHFDTETYFAD